MASRTGKKHKAGIRSKLLKIIRYMVFSFGCLFILMLLLAATTLPFYAWYNLGVKNSELSAEPEFIILMGGSSIPSENGLLRAYYTSALSDKFPKAQIIVAIPGSLSDPNDAPKLIEKELIQRSSPDQAVMLINKGSNTRQQALEIAKKLRKDASIALVTSPEHMYRAVLTFKKAGFTTVGGVPTFEQSLNESAILFDDPDLKGNKIAPPIGKNLTVRYQFWHHLKLEIIVAREYFAIAYYKLRGWI